MLTTHWTQNDDGRISATWTQDTAREIKPHYLLLTEPEPVVAPAPFRASVRPLAAMRAWLYTALHPSV